MLVGWATSSTSDFSRYYVNTNCENDAGDDEDVEADDEDEDEEYFAKNDFACRAHLSFHYSEETVN